MYGLVESRGGMSLSLVSMIASDPRSRAPPHGHLGHCVRAAFLVKIAFKTTQRVFFRLKSLKPYLKEMESMEYGFCWEQKQPWNGYKPTHVAPHGWLTSKQRDRARLRRAERQE